MGQPIPSCPRCGAAHVVRNGKTRAGSANLKCRGCGRAFAPDPRRAPITPDREALVRRLPLERLSPRAVARAAGVSRSWLQRFTDRLYRGGTPRTPGRLEKKGGDLTGEAGELWGYVGPKGRVCRVWVALDAATRQVVAMVTGDRSGAADRHAPAGEGEGPTNHVERFWRTPRQRRGRLVGKALSFSKCPRNHVGSLWYFVRHYNASLR